MRIPILFLLSLSLFISSKAQFNVPNTNIWYNSSTSMTGVGLSTPATHFQVNGNMAATIGPSAAMTGFVQLWSDNAVIWKSNNQNGGLRFGSATDLGAGSWSEKMRITDAGFVGIGVQPQRVLDITTSQSNGCIRINYNGAGAVLLHPNSLTGGSWNNITQPGDAGIIYQSLSGPGATFGFVIAPWANATSGIRLDPNGNVGIGTALTGTSKLAVEGTIAARKVVVTATSPWPDYVFANGYSLPSLPRLSQYIKAHHHLPDMPPADSVARNGLDLGGNQAALLKKIEELTLYVIDQQQQIARLKERDKELEYLKAQIDELKGLRKPF